MGFSAFLLYVVAVLSAVLFRRGQLRWRRLRSRPVLTFAQVAAARPGTKVIVTGRTGNGRLGYGPFSGEPCVWYQIVRRATREISSEATETTETVEQEWGDRHLYTDDGDAPTRIPVTVTLGRQSLLASRSPMIRQSVADRDGGTRPGKSITYRLHEYVVVADRPVTVAGVVRRRGAEPELARDDWTDGTVVGAEPSELSTRYAGFQRWSFGISLLSAVLAVLLTIAAVG
ncbi:hypothetical protein O7632_01035 [Solwaraspora sp. WMMD406]|uniref:hypothetical protein n=1 Tax=Solwaraspora sp. WMMD406 TaxID=3016095 RepID=UPI0024178094|nr:hypothetical protein [Solwaraspora sp. WMMD406]MDG4762706.1 hypothetical protein [Solwaraspora sp. WMMD406]